MLACLLRRRGGAARKVTYPVVFHSQAGQERAARRCLVAGRQSNVHIELMATTQKRRQRRSPGSGKLPAKPGFRSPIRISIDHEALAALDKRALAAQIGIGVVAGWLASWLVGGTGLLRYVLTGLIGSFVGGALLEHFGLDFGLRSETANRIATATLGAVVVVLLARLVS